MNCPSCGRENPTGQKFCGECGTRLTAAAETERRQLTVMFVDLVGSTALSGRLDPEELGEIIEAYQRTCREALEPWEGFVARSDERLDDLKATFEEMAAYHPEEPCWYLPLIGVEPYAQGRGLGGALMQRAVARCDREGSVAYLESSNPRNVSLYRRYGFEPLGEIQKGAGPLVTPMSRRPIAGTS